MNFLFLFGALFPWIAYIIGGFGFGFKTNDQVLYVAASCLLIHPIYFTLIYSVFKIKCQTKRPI